MFFAQGIGIINRCIYLPYGILVSFFAFFTSATFANGNVAAWSAHTWRSDDGLQDNKITGIVQSADGYLWIGTHGGLMRFNGVKFDDFSPSPVNGAQTTEIRSLALDHSSRLWLARDNDLVECIDGEHATVFAHVPASGPWALLDDEEGSVWVANRRSLTCLKSGKAILFGGAEGLPAGDTQCRLAHDGKGRLWFEKSGKVGFVKDGKLTTVTTFRGQVATRVGNASGNWIWVATGPRILKQFPNGDQEEITQLPKEVVPNCILEDRDGAIWIGTDGDLFRKDESGLKKVYSFQHWIACMLQDREGNIWVGTDGGGLTRLRRQAVGLIGKAEGLPFEAAKTISEDTTGALWAVSQNGELIRKNGAEWELMSKPPLWPGGRASSIATDPSGAIWVARMGSKDLLQYRNGTFEVWQSKTGSVCHGNMFALFVSSTGDLWATSLKRIRRLRGGEMKTFDISDKPRAPRAITEDSAGNIWIGTSAGYLFRITGDELTDETKKVEGSPPYTSIRCLTATSDGSIWIGYAGRGLGRLKAGSYHRITTANGLHDNYISQIIPDDHGRLWLASNHGIFQLSIQEISDLLDGRTRRVRSIIYGQEEGLRSIQACYEWFPAATPLHNGRFWIATLAGLAAVTPDNVRDNLEAPSVYLEQVRIDGKPFASREARSPLLPKTHANLRTLDQNTVLQIEAAPRRVDFDFAALSFTAPENVQFRYKLEGIDNDWIDASEERTASYSHLAPGKYRFRVIACNNTGLWNEAGAMQDFVVTPFFWQTSWFRFSAVTLFTMIVVSVVRYVSFRRLRQRLQESQQLVVLAKERTRIAQDLHDDIGARLTKIVLLSDLADRDYAFPEKVRAHVRKLSSMTRQGIESLDETVWLINPRNDTLANFISYVGQFAVEFLQTAQIRCRPDLPTTTPDIPISAKIRHNLLMATKESLNNVVRHANATEVQLSLSTIDQWIEINVEDNGCGFEDWTKDPSSDGLRNMVQRMEEIHGHCRIQSNPNTGTHILFRCPFQTHS